MAALDFALRHFGILAFIYRRCEKVLAQALETDIFVKMAGNWAR